MRSFRAALPTFLFAAFVAFVAPASPAPAQNQNENPFDAEQRRLGAEAAREGRAPRGILPLLELWRGFDRASPAVTKQVLEGLYANRSLAPSRRAYAGSLLARARLRTGDAAGEAQLIDELGYVTSWNVVGPFDNEGKQGFDTEMPPEAARREAFDAAARWPGRERPVGWREMPRVSRVGYVNFDSVFRPNENVCGFAQTWIHSERAQPLSLWLGNGGAAKMWWNGEEVLRDEKYRQPDPDRHVAIVGAHQGANRLLIKVCVAETTWGFFLRVGDAQGGPARGVRAEALPNPEPAVPAGHGPGRRPTAPQTPLAALDAAGSAENARPQALEDLARFLAFTGADDRAERRARQIAARAAEAEPTIRRLRLAIQLADERHEAQRFAARAEQIAPNDPDSKVIRATILRGGPEPERALPLLDSLPPGTMAWMEGALIRASILRELDLPEAAARAVEAAAVRAENAPGFIQARAEAAVAARRNDRALELRRAAVAARWDDQTSRRVLIEDAIQRGDTQAIGEHLDAIHLLDADDVRGLVYIAGIHDALGRESEALAMYAEALALAPEDAGLHAAHGRMLLRMQQPDAAADAFRRAIAIRPQDAETRELLEHLRPARPREDEAWAVGTRELLARRVEQPGYPITVLQDLTVNTVFENGLGSAFHQLAVQVHDAEGARRWRTYSVQFDPGAQRVDIRAARVYRGERVLEANQTFEQQLGEPWYRIYYDTRALVVVFPDLEPGDVVELRYRVDDVSHRNLFRDYYGDVRFLQGFSPIRSLDYVLITPAARQFYFNEPRLPQLRRTTRERDGKRIDHFHAEDLPAIRDEQGMPGMTEISPYLHVSTYRTWEDVGRWYWGLIRDQLYADESLRRTVQDLVRGAPDTRTKVQRIYAWVLEHTRYVGLEFGIHGYLPYRVPQIIQRGFGDCKDKASVLYTMFREAGIDARMVLVRTRRNGAINDLPASLAVFDHAIAYVPELDLYLDGTAEHNGTMELPPMDQGVTVLLVGPQGAELRRTPVLPPDANRRTRQLQLELAADGAAQIEMRDEVRGADAAHYRETFEAEGTREDRLERELQRIFPNLELTSQQFEHLDDREQPIVYRVRGTAPQLAREDSGELRLGPTVLEDLVRMLARTPSRRYTLDLGGTSSYVEERSVRIPANMRFATVPDGGEAASDFGRLTIRIQANARELTARTELELRRDRVTAEEYPQFREWVRRADEILRQRIGVARGGAR